jgi:hypothetical protein
MAKLTYRKRQNLPNSAFAWPEKRKFPIYDKAHVKAAPARLSAEVHAGRIGPARAEMIHRNIAHAGKRFGVHISPLHTRRAAPGHRYAAENPLTTSEMALIVGGVVIVGGLGYLFYKASQPAAATASPVNQPITYGQITGATAPPSLLAPGYQGQASGPAPAGSAEALPIDMGTVAS